MKLVKMSLAAAMLMGASAYALDDVKFNGEAKLWYQTTDSTDLFDQASSVGQASFVLGMTGKASDTVSFNLETTALDTLGLESNLVSGVTAGTTMADGTATTLGDAVATQWWVSQANLAIKLGNTTAVLGRQALDTPLAFTEKWNVVKNTFDAAVVVNSDIPNTTLVAAYVGKENSAATANSTAGNNGTVVNGGTFQSYAAGLGGSGGAYAVGAVFAGVPDVTMQGWYYNVLDLATAYWLQVDGKVALGNDMGLSYGVQYANVELDGADANTAYALKVGYSVSGVNMNASYSSVSDDNLAGVGMNNVTTQDQTKLYTGAGLNGQLLAMGSHINVAGPDTSAWTVGVDTTVSGATLMAEYTSVDAANVDKSMWAVAAVTNVAGIDLLAGVTGADTGTADVTAVRITAGLKF